MPFGDFFAAWAPLTRLTGRTLFTVQGLGQNSGYGGFPDSSHARKHIGMSDPFMVYGILQGLYDMRLTDDFIKGSRTIFSCGDLIFHDEYSQRPLGWGANGKIFGATLLFLLD
jgi:hypothetical protein